MAGEWIQYKLADICNSIDYGLTASASDSEVGPKFLRITDIVAGHIDWKTVPFVVADDQTFSNYQLFDKDIVIARTGASTGVSAFIIKPPRAVFASYLVRLRIKQEFDERFVSYYLRSSVFWTYIKGVLGDKSAQPNASASTMTNAPILVPKSKTEQRAIACILGALDDKIELNRRMNETLEQIAQAIFKKWFIEPTKKGKLPEGLREGKFEDMVIAKQGKYLPNDEIIDFPNDNFIYPVWGGNGIRGYTYNKMYDAPVLVLTCRGSNCGLINITEEPSWISNIAFACEAKIGSIEFVYIYFKNCSFEDCISGSAQPQITYNLLKNKQMPYPISQKIVNAFSNLVFPIFKKIMKNNSQSRTLAALRDTLLPKLISGELRVPDAEKICARGASALGGMEKCS